MSLQQIIYNELEDKYDFYISENMIPVKVQSEQDYFLNQSNEDYLYSFILMKKKYYPAKEIDAYVPKWNQKYEKIQKYILVKEKDRILQYIQDYPLKMFEMEKGHRKQYLLKQWMKEIEQKYPDILIKENEKKFFHYVQELGVYNAVYLLGKSQEDKLKKILKFEKAISLKKTSFNKLYQFIQQNSKSKKEGDEFFLKFLLQKKEKKEITIEIEQKLVSFLKIIFLEQKDTLDDFLKKLQIEYHQQENLQNFLKIEKYQYQEICEIDFDILLRKIPFKQEKVINLFHNIMSFYSKKENIKTNVLLLNETKLTVAFFSNHQPINLEKIKTMYLEAIQCIPKEDNLYLSEKVFEAIYLNNTLEKKEVTQKLKI
jgi:hypothetical protein